MTTPKYNDEPIIGIDLGTTFSCVAIMRNEKKEIIADNKNGDKIIASVVCFKSNSECLIGNLAKNNMLQYSQSTMFDSKRLLGYKFANKNIQEDIKNWPVIIKEDKKTGKPKYVIKVENEEKEYFPEDVASMILNYLKTYSENYINKEIKKVVIGVPANFNNLQRKATIEAAEEAGFEDIKLINEPTAAAIAYGDTIKSNKERKILIFDLGGGTFDVSIIKIKGNKYNVLASLGEEHLGGEDFNQRIINYVINEIKNNDNFKDIDFSKKDEKKIINTLKRINKKAEEVKIELSNSFNSSFYIDDLCGIDDFEIEITRNKYEELCMDLWNKCLIKVNDALQLSKLKKEEIDEIILVGGSTKTPKIKKMISEHFNGKEPLQNINPDEVVAQGALLAAYLDLNIHDITSKAIGILIGNNYMDIIIPPETQLPLYNEKPIVFSKSYILKSTNEFNIQNIGIFQGNNKDMNKNFLLGVFSIQLGNVNTEKKIKISMNIDHNSILEVVGYINNEKNVEIRINMNTI